MRLSAGRTYAQRPAEQLVDSSAWPSPNVQAWPTSGQTAVLVRLLQERGLSAVSIGCGEGAFEAQLEEAGVPVRGVDLDVLPSYKTMRCFLRGGIIRVRPDELFRIDEPSRTCLCFVWGRALPWREYLSCYPQVPLVCIIGESASTPEESVATVPSSNALEADASWSRLHCGPARAVHGGAVMCVYERAPASLTSLAADELQLMLPWWGLRDARAAACSCRVMHSALGEAVAAAATVVARLERLSAQMYSARLPRPVQEANGMMPRLLTSALALDEEEAPKRLLPDVRFDPDGSAHGRFSNTFAASWLDWGSMGLAVDEAATLSEAMRTDLAANHDLANALLLLSLSCNPIRDAGASALVQVLPELHSLTALEIEDCQVGDAGAAALAAALLAEPRGGTAFRGRLRRLCLGCNPIGDDGCVALARALTGPRLLHPTHARGLAVLQLGDTDVGDVGAEALAGALEQGAMPDGLQLWLASTRVSQAGRAGLMRASAARRGLRVCW